MTELFGGLPEQAVPPAPGRGTPRLRQPERDPPGWQILALDDLVTPDHPVRAVWAFVQRLDLQPLHEAVRRARGSRGRRRRHRSCCWRCGCGPPSRDRQRPPGGSAVH